MEFNEVYHLITYCLNCIWRDQNSTYKKTFDNTKYDMTRNLTRFYTKVYNVFTHSVPLSSAEAYKKFLMREKWARKKWREERNKGSLCKLM
jgi:hypothetical protein